MSEQVGECVIVRAPAAFVTNTRADTWAFVVDTWAKRCSRVHHNSGLFVRAEIHAMTDARGSERWYYDADHTEGNPREDDGQ